MCRGDNLLRNDPAVPVSDVLGRAVDVIGDRSRLRAPVATSFVRFRWVARSTSMRVRHVRDEVLLLAREARGEGVEAGGLSAIGLPDGPEACTGAKASDDARVPPAGPGPGAKMIPAGVFSRAFPESGASRCWARSALKSRLLRSLEGTRVGSTGGSRSSGHGSNPWVFVRATRATTRFLREWLYRPGTFTTSRRKNSQPSYRLRSVRRLYRSGKLNRRPGPS